MARAARTEILCPFVPLVDTREQAPYTFRGLRAGAAQKHLPLVVEWEWQALPTGDYSVKGFERSVCIERKSLEDLFSTLGSGRERFEREHERMAEYQFAAVVVEADWRTIIREPPPESKLNPKSVYRTAIAWAQRYGVHWWAVDGRQLAEVTTFRMLERFYHDQMAKLEGTN